MTTIRGAGATDRVGRCVTGIGVAWIVAPILVLLAALARGGEGGWVGPALVAVGLAAASGFVLGWASLGWAGLAGAVAGTIVELALPYLAVPAILGLTIWGVDVYAEYVPGAVVATAAAIVGCSFGIRRARGWTLPLGPTITAGLCVLAAWFGIWLVMGRSIGVAA
jgi:hypothetical protein